MSGFPGQVRALRWSPDGSQLLAAGGEAITSWDFTRTTPAGQQPRVIGGHIGAIVDIGFRPASSQQFATIGTDGCWMLWELPADLRSDFRRTHPSDDH